ncbi:MAG: hypothetical protein HYU42_02455 [Candidatus Rokubacteria bacterium]|nr:hypothetical protein [Candidatus Rokubacteria bacterium]MBI2197451.1 hypothetical protein [Candidatus Rokubacteria bacterium]
MATPSDSRLRVVESAPCPGRRPISTRIPVDSRRAKSRAGTSATSTKDATTTSAPPAT